MMKQTWPLRAAVTLLAASMAGLIVFGTFSLGVGGSLGFSVDYSYFDVFKNTGGKFNATGVWTLRLAGGIMGLAMLLAWIKAPFASLAGGIVSGGWFIYNTIYRLRSGYDFFEGTADCFIYALPAAACILCLLLFRQTKRIH